VAPKISFSIAQKIRDYIFDNIEDKKFLNQHFDEIIKIFFDLKDLALLFNEDYRFVYSVLFSKICNVVDLVFPIPEELCEPDKSKFYILIVILVFFENDIGDELENFLQNDEGEPREEDNLSKESAEDSEESLEGVLEKIAPRESVIGFLAIFKTVSIAEQFLANFYSYIGTDLKIELALELQAPVDDCAALEVIQAVSSDLDVICLPEVRNNFKRLVVYSNKVASFFSEHITESHNNIKDKIVELFVTYFKIQHNNILPKEIAKFRKNVIHQWNDKLQLFVDKKSDTKTSIEIYLQIAKCNIGMFSSLSINKIERFFELGVSLRAIDEYCKMVPANSDRLLPNIVVSDKKYFICKLSFDDLRGPFLGLVTCCCQHLDGVGYTAAKYGYVQENSCFYVMFKGSPPGNSHIDTNTLSTKNIVAQCWAWRNIDSDTVAFDSVEAGRFNDSIKSKLKVTSIKKLFYELARQIVISSKSSIKRVLIGDGGTIEKFGIPAEYSNNINYHVDTPKNPWYVKGSEDDYETDELIYTDAAEQAILYDHDLAYLAKYFVLEEVVPEEIQKLENSYILESILDNIIRSRRVDDVIKLINTMNQPQCLLFMSVIEKLLPQESRYKYLKKDLYLHIFIFFNNLKNCWPQVTQLLSDGYFMGKLLGAFEYKLSAIISYVVDEKCISFFIENCFDGLLLDKQNAKDFLHYLYLASDELSLSLKNDGSLLYPMAIRVMSSFPDLVKHTFGFKPDRCHYLKICICEHEEGSTRLMINELTRAEKIYVNNYLAFALLNCRGGTLELQMLKAILKNPSVVPEMLSPCQIIGCECTFHSSRKLQYPLIYALEAGYEDKVVMVLEWSGFADEMLLQTDNAGHTMLIVAIRAGRQKVVEAILNSHLIDLELLNGAQEAITEFADKFQDVDKLLRDLNEIKNQLSTKKSVRCKV